MFTTLRDAWRIPELRKKLMFTAMIMLIYRICYVIPVPFVNTQEMVSFFNSGLQNTMLGFYNVMGGYGFSNASILSLGIQPYINASIIIQLLCVAIPALERMAKEEGEEGKKKINKITRYSTIGLSVLLGYGSYVLMTSVAAKTGHTVIEQTGFLPALLIILTLTAGSCLVMWLGEQITEKGIGNGISIILFVGIVSGLPTMFAQMALSESFKWWMSLIIGVVMLLLVVFIVFINDTERRIPIQYAKRVVGRKVYGGQNTNLPIKVAMSGVMPVIFAQSICSVPALICGFMGINEESGNWWYNNLFSSTSVAYLVIYGLMIFFFSWFYSQIQYDPVEISNNLKKNGGFIPGFRPGKPTADFIAKVIGKLVIFGAVYLALVSMLPMVGAAVYPAISALGIGGTSIIIVVGVALETVKALDSQMLMRHYKGFLD